MSFTPDSIAGVDVGTRVANDTATILACSSVHEPGDGFVAHSIVLAVTDTGNFVTWLYRLDNKRVSSGEYSPTIEAALEQFYDRCGTYRLRPLRGTAERPGKVGAASRWRR